MGTLAVTETQAVDAAGTVRDYFEITYELAGRPGAFTFTVPKLGDPVAQAQAARDELVATVNALYGL